MPTVDIIDEAFIVASRRACRAELCPVARWRTWFPQLTLTPYDDRGLDGVRWRVSGELVGTAEVWLEQYGDGVIVHTYVRAEPATAARALPRRADRWVRRRYALPLKRHLLGVKDALEAGRQVGEPRVP
ncbi:MAG: SRPBCC family protein, partial [Nocardioidaceae bacterium]